MILNQMTDLVFVGYGRLLSDLAQPWLSQANLSRFADAVHAKGAALENCWGFVNGTVRLLSRPGQNQQILYNCHKGCMP